MPIVKIGDKLVLFIHVPRTGGTTIEHHLGERGVLFFKNVAGTATLRVTAQHLHGSELTGLFPDNLFDYAFMIVRHPVHRLVSVYRHERATQPQRWRLPFPVWLRLAMLRRNIKPYRRDNHLRPQVEFECFNAEVFKFEEGLDKPFVRLEQRLGIPRPPQLATLKSNTEEQPIVGAREIDVIYRVYRADFDRYGYNPAKL